MQARIAQQLEEARKHSAAKNKAGLTKRPMHTKRENVAFPPFFSWFLIPQIIQLRSIILLEAEKDARAADKHNIWREFVMCFFGIFL